MNKPTPGPWMIDERTGIIVIYAGPENTEPCIAGAESRAIVRFDGHRTASGSGWEVPPEKIGNARLIVAAVNSCFAVNPSNPLAVAEALREIINASHAALADHDERKALYPAREGQENRLKVMGELRTALAKLEAKP